MKVAVRWIPLLMFLICPAVWANNENPEPPPVVQGPTVGQGGENAAEMKAMVSGQQQIVGEMLNTLRELARMTREEAKTPERQSDAAEMVDRIDRMKDQHDMMVLAMKTPAKPVR